MSSALEAIVVDIESSSVLEPTLLRVVVENGVKVLVIEYQ